MQGGSAMKLALAEMAGYVAPRLAWSTQLRVAVVEPGRVVSQQTQDVRHLGPLALVNFLGALAPDALVCGGIPPECERALEQHGIKVVWGVIGTIQQALLAVVRGELCNDEPIDSPCAGAAQAAPSRGGAASPTL
jgi:predicted Fe-Mo cluster-binding NifX family protein